MAIAAARAGLCSGSGKATRGSRKCNLKARSVQANPNKTKQKSLDLLGFIRPNRDFSMGYEQKNKKIDSRLKLYAKRLNPPRHSLPRFRGLWPSPYPDKGNYIAHRSIFVNHSVCLHRFAFR
jgi:hypothetical protein